MTNILLIGFFGGLGAILRYWTGLRIDMILLNGFPWGTVFVNIIGSLLIGFLFSIFETRDWIYPSLKLGLTVGLLGGFTTFSAFSLDTVNLLNNGYWVKAMSYVVLSICGCIFAASLGLLIGRNI